MQLKLLLGELGRKNLIIHAGFWPELKVINQKVSERPEQIDLVTLA